MAIGLERLARRRGHRDRTCQRRRATASARSLLFHPIYPPAGVPRQVSPASVWFDSARLARVDSDAGVPHRPVNSPESCGFPGDTRRAILVFFRELASHPRNTIPLDANPFHSRRHALRRRPPAGARNRAPSASDRPAVRSFRHLVRSTTAACRVVRRGRRASSATPLLLFRRSRVARLYSIAVDGRPPRPRARRRAARRRRARRPAPGPRALSLEVRDRQSRRDPALRAAGYASGRSRRLL